MWKTHNFPITLANVFKKYVVFDQGDFFLASVQTLFIQVLNSLLQKPTKLYLLDLDNIVDTSTDSNLEITHVPYVRQSCYPSLHRSTFISSSRGIEAHGIEFPVY